MSAAKRLGCCLPLAAQQGKSCSATIVGRDSWFPAMLFAVCCREGGLPAFVFYDVKGNEVSELMAGALQLPYTLTPRCAHCVFRGV